MSTFSGVVDEFPNIRVDNFLDNPTRRPLAYFLSHIHSDHLKGLEAFVSPFIYCSAATKAMLLKLETAYSRINYHLGFLEARKPKYSTRVLKDKIKPLPLETPTVIELCPGDEIQVTLFDANHCPGAVMFLFEGKGKAVLYTGDIRCEPWFVNNIVNNPSMHVLGKYVSGKKRLDMLYLDTTFLGDDVFSTKKDGIDSICAKVRGYPLDTVFHFQAWTYGYEDVWVALAQELETKIHVDPYKLRVYASLVHDSINRRTKFGPQLAPEGSRLIGFMCGNTPHEGCLTSTEQVRLHSCEKGAYCDTLRQADREGRVVWIKPSIAQLANGQWLAEAGVGGGGSDLGLEVDVDDLLSDELEQTLHMLASDDRFPDELRVKMVSVLDKLGGTNADIVQDPVLDDDVRTIFGAALKLLNESVAIPLEDGTINASHENNDDVSDIVRPCFLTFPFSRHSSGPELRHLVEVLKPRDIWPCTTDPFEWWKQGLSIQKLFGRQCSGTEFRYDRILSNHVAQYEELALNSESQFPDVQNSIVAPNVEDSAGAGEDSQSSSVSQVSYGIREAAFRTMLAVALGDSDVQMGGLISTTDNHTTADVELGEAIPGDRVQSHHETDTDAFP